MDRKMITTGLDKQITQDVFCRTITFTVFSFRGISASKLRENR